MPKINLVHAMGLRKKRRTVSADTVFYISKKHQHNIYYVKDVDSKTRVVTWVKHRRRAVCFHTQQAVYQYIHAHMNDRNDVYLVNAAEET